MDLKNLRRKVTQEHEFLHEGWPTSLRVITTNFRVQYVLAHGPVDAVTSLIRAHSLISSTATLDDDSFSF